MAWRDPASGQPPGIHSAFHLLAEVVVHVGRVQQQADLLALRDVESPAAEGAQPVVQPAVRASSRWRHHARKVFFKNQVRFYSCFEDIFNVSLSFKAKLLLMENQLCYTSLRDLFWDTRLRYRDRNWSRCEKSLHLSAKWTHDLKACTLPLCYNYLLPKLSCRLMHYWHLWTFLKVCVLCSW